MKTHTDPRHLQRIKIVQDLFSQSFNSQKFQSETSKKIWKNLTSIDSKITAIAPLWPIDKIGKVDLAILRLAIYELTIEKINPQKVIIDEAVELAKEFGGENSSSFINGALGVLVQQKK